jgi:hypothetical protein
MTKVFLIASVAALAITAPAQAERGGKHRQQAAEQAQAPQQSREQRGQARAERPQPVERQQRAERPQRSFEARGFNGGGMPRVERRARPERFERPERQAFQQPRVERRARPERFERPMRPAFEQRAPRFDRQVERRARVQDFTQRPARQVEHRKAFRPERVRPERVAKQDRFDRQARFVDLRGRQSIERAHRDDRFAVRQLRQQQRQAERLAKAEHRFEQRLDRRQALTEQRARLADLAQQRTAVYAPVRQDWYGDYAAQRYSSFYRASPDYFYDYNYGDGYLYQFDRDDDLVTAMFPLLGGAFGVGQLLPIGYSSYNVPYGYRSLYYDTPDYSYRYGDGAIYRVDPDTQLIQAVVALLTGQQFGVGQLLPAGYDVYNVPYQYRDMYYDTSDAWYRYDDGYIYQVDPYTRMIEDMYPVSYGQYAVGYPAPIYAGYGYPSYAVPYAYQNLYYADPGYNYYYADNGIYQVDPTTRLVQALVALVTGANLGVGQLLPVGYDAYNVPYQYRASYFDTPDMWYRYDDGYIYGVDPRTRLIETVVPVSYGGYSVGYPMPAYAGYAVPSAYDGLYYAQPGYDYRYANGGIYQVDPTTRLVQAVAALLTGQNLGVGQMLPAGYDVYNVPLAYRGQYYDTPDAWYRYADGNIYRVDPQTRVIQTVITTIV